MPTNIVFSFIGDDEPGLVDRISEVVGQHDGNWLESRLSRLAGKFAGIIQVGVEDQRAKSLVEAINKLSTSGLSVLCEQCDASSGRAASQTLSLSVLGLDRRHIVHEVSQALAGQRINVIEMTTEISPAPMSGELLFNARAIVEAPHDADLDALHLQLEAISRELAVDIELDPTPSV